MNKAKHLSMLVFKIIFIILYFALATVMNALEDFSLDRLGGIKGATALDECEILVFDAKFPVTGASLSYEVVDGDIVFDIRRGNDRYDDIAVLITYPAPSYDSSEMREYLYETLGDAAASEEDYLTAMEEGPWRLTYSFSLTGENTEKTFYTLTDPDGYELTEKVTPSGRADDNYIRDIYGEKGDKLSFMLTFGAQGKGALPSGRYTFSGDLGFAGLYDGPAGISAGSALKVFGTTCVNAVAEKGLGIFEVENWLSFYGAMCVFGMFIYLWRDVRAMIKIFGAIIELGGSAVPVIVRTYVNGVCTDEYRSYQGGMPVWVALIITVLCFMVFILSIPIRILIHLVRDIIYLFAEDYELDGFSYVGNILGSVGIYAAVFGVAMLAIGNLLVGGIAAGAGILSCLLASYLCKRCEEEYG